MVGFVCRIADAWSDTDHWSPKQGNELNNKKNAWMSMRTLDWNQVRKKDKREIRKIKKILMGIEPGNGCAIFSHTLRKLKTKTL